MIALRIETSVIKLAAIECTKISTSNGIVAAASPPTFVVDERLGPWSRTEKAAAKKMTNRNWAAKSGAPQNTWLIMLNSQQKNRERIACRRPVKAQPVSTT